MHLTALIPRRLTTLWLYCFKAEAQTTKWLEDRTVAACQHHTSWRVGLWQASLKMLRLVGNLSCKGPQLPSCPPHLSPPPSQFCAACRPFRRKLSRTVPGWPHAAAQGETTTFLLAPPRSSGHPSRASHERSLLAMRDLRRAPAAGPSNSLLRLSRGWFYERNRADTPQQTPLSNSL